MQERNGALLVAEAVPPSLFKARGLKKKLFLIEDEPDMVKIATDLLEGEGYVVGSALHPDAGLKEIRKNPPDLLLLDIRLPDKDGYEVLKELKSDPKTNHVPVIVVSVRADETDVVVGLQLGADDYISKPFRKKELVARVKAVLRRHEPHTAAQIVELGPIRVDFASYTATVEKKPLSLTPKEFELLGYFLKNEGRVLTRPSLSEHVWGFEYTGSTRTIDVHVDQLRRKLGKLGACIKGLKGVGYRFELDD